jgi:glucan biosynthesis protein C
MATAQDMERRIDLDWVRIIAFAVLIFYHVACFYAPGPAAVGAASPRTVPWLLIPSLLVNPWRLMILFLVSGAATRFMRDKMSLGALFSLRSRRLLIPLAFVMLLVAPAQGFVQAAQRCGFTASYFSFWARYLGADQHICPAQFPLPTPSWSHLWFVAYLWVFTALLVGALAIAPRLAQRLQSLAERVLSGWGLVLWPLVWLSLAWTFVQGRFPETGALLGDWYAEAIYVPVFLFGFLLAKSDAIWDRIERLRWPALAIALTQYAVVVAGAFYVLGPTLSTTPGVPLSPKVAEVTPLRALAGFAYGADQWFWILASLGFARRWLSQSDGPVRRYLTDAIFPFYIVHEATIQVGGYSLTKLRLPLGLEAATLIAATIASCLATYEIVRRAPLLRPLFGLKPAPAPARDSRMPPGGRWLAPAAERALQEAAERRASALRVELPREYGGARVLEPTRYGDWEHGGLASDF